MPHPGYFRKTTLSRPVWMHTLVALVMTCPLIIQGAEITSEKTTASEAMNEQSVQAVAAEVDRLINEELQASGSEAAPLTNDEDFLRRAYFDLTGTAPATSDIIRFGLTPNSSKRSAVIDQLLEKPAYTQNWAQYWRDVIYSRATDPRANRQEPVFVKWMSAELAANKSWDQITTELLTATGRMSEDGSTGLVFAHNADGETIAAEASRIFMGIQIQCAQCHDHFTDKWTRVQFHELASFFPRIKIRRVDDSQPRDFEVYSADARPQGKQQELLASLEDPEQFFKEMDKNNDNQLSPKELAGPQNGGLLKRVLAKLDTNKDKQLTLEELKNFTVPANFKKNQAEHFMPDLNDPSAKGTKMSPVFFLTEEAIEEGLQDVKRREEAARFITSSDNEWFARAYINRIWTVLLGEGFYPAIDDIGPERDVHHPAVIDLLAQEFSASGYDVKWLFRVIMNTEAYQRQSVEMDPSQESPDFAAVIPTRLRADQLYEALVCALDIEATASTSPDNPKKGRKKVKDDKGDQRQFKELFEYDPSEDVTDISGTIPQALFLMNSPKINNLIENQNSFVRELLERKLSDTATTTEIYLQILGREPDSAEQELVAEYIKSSENQQQAYEDLVWSLINSTEFMTKR
ncbi:MAG: DUF1549 domain-containing protein [Planctomycetaceae bacterium]